MKQLTTSFAPSIIIFFGFFCSYVSAQSFNVSVTELTSSQGLSGLAVMNLFVDSDSKIWIETEHDLEFWDGRKFRKSPLPIIPSSLRINSKQNTSTIGEDEHFVYFIYDQQPQSYYKYDKVSHVFNKSTFNETQADRQSRIVSAIDAKQLPWILRTEKNTTIISPITGESELVVENKTLGLGAVKEFCIGEKGFWIRDSLLNLIHLTKEGSIKRFDAPQHLNDLEIGQITNAFIEDRQGTLFYSTPGTAGIFSQSLEHNKPIKIKNFPTDQVVVNMWIDQHGRRLAALSKQQQVIKNYMLSDSISEFRMWNLLAEQSVIPTRLVSNDFHQLIYYGTHQGLKIIKFGVPYLDKILQKEHVASNQYGTVITSFASPNSHTTIVGTETEASYLFNSSLNQVESLSKNTVGQYPHLHSATNMIISQFSSKDPYRDYIRQYDVVTSEVTTDTIPIHVSAAIQFTDSLYLFAGDKKNCSGMVLYNIFNRSQKSLPTENYPLIAKSNLNHLHYDKNNQRLYFGSFDNGLLIAQCKKNEIAPAYFPTTKELPKKNIISISQDRRGNLLVGSYNGLYILNSESLEIIQHLTTKEGLSNNVITAVVQDDKHRYWATTFSGLNMINSTDWSIGNFFVEDGTTHNEYNRNSFHTSPSGTLYFGSANGITAVNPTAYDTYISQFEIQFSQAEMRTTDVDLHLDTLPKAALRVSVNRLMHLDISLGNSAWGATDNVEYYYQIQGLEDQWFKSTDGDFRIDRLPPGEFNIHIKGLSGYGQWSSNVLHFPIKVFTPFFYKTWVRIILFGLLLALFATSFLWRKQKQLKQRLSFQQRVSDLELSLLQSQMNPHFIFNALGSIQYYIFNNQKDIAEEYLSKFAGLMRMFLESSRNKFISLKDELKLLNGYIELEHLRFPNKFESETIVDLEDSPDNYSIPSMLLQPFVENSINHGIFHLKANGKLILNIHDDDDFLYCIIEDNGIGRATAKELRAKSLRNHKSRATEITEERIEILKEVENLHMEISYYDFSPEQDGQTGTRVTIKIPHMIH